jgi:hypothetical protein
MAKASNGFTADELLGELRRRQRLRTVTATGAPTAKARGGMAGAGAPDRGLTTRFHDLTEIHAGELAKLLKARQRAVYGTDDRKETMDIADRRTLPLAEASAALVTASDLTATAGGGFRLRTTSYQEEYQLCDREPFAKQPLGCFCSGVLVAPDVIATAGHCLKKASDLPRMRIVFGFRMIDTATARTEFPAKDVYEPVQIIDRVYTETGADWALLRLDRPVVGRTPVAVRSAGKVGDRESIFVIGHPCGLPQKVAGKARVRDNRPSSHFAANLDTYGGNSGSPVFSGDSYQLEGLLVRGQTDFVAVGGCNVSMVFPTTGAGGEDVMRAPEWAGRLKAPRAKRTAPVRSPARKRAVKRPRSSK